jgi:hypothetical protein
VASDFSLIDAIESGIVKIPRVPVDDDRVGREVTYLNLWAEVRDHLPKTGRRTGPPFTADDLPHTLQSALHSLYGSYEKAFRAWETSQARNQGQPPPVFIVVCSNTTISQAVYQWIGGWDRPVGEDTTVAVPGRLDLFSNVVDSRWLHRQPTILVDAEELESGALSPEFRRAAAPEIAEFKREYAHRFPGRSADDLGDAELLREVMNTVGKPGKLGEQVRCVVSVSMLTEGWDANTVTHILGIRAFGTQLLCEQVVGRGLRRRSYVVDEETGRFTPEYADVYGVPFQFIPTVAASRELTLKPTRHVRAEPDRAAKLEITFPRLVGYHVEMPDAPLIADLSVPEAKLVLSKADIPTETIVSGLIGEPEVHSLDDLRAVREQRIVYRLAAKVLEDRLRSGAGDLRPWYFPQLLPIVRDWLRECVVLHDDTFPGMLLLREPEAAERIWHAIGAQGYRSKYVLPVLRAAEPVGSTSVVDFHTTREVYPTREDRCPVNFVTLDGAGGNAWERSVAQSLEALPEVASYVKNDHLDFAIPYEHAGRTHRFYPDFLVRLTALDDGVPRTLVVEVSGGRKAPGQSSQKAGAARQLWVPAVNNHGGFGRWSFCELRDPTRAKLEFAPAIAALYADRGVCDIRDPDDQPEVSFVVQTNTKVIERCMLMCTDPGDLVLDPTCGSGTTAYVAEGWGRRWITIDTSRVAIALARQRIIGAKYPAYLLADSAEGRQKERELTGQVPPADPPAGDIRKGFVYQRVPHVTLKSIANNPDIREGMSRAEIDAAIRRHAGSELLYDQPYEANRKIRVAGRFTVESLSPHRSASFEIGYEQPASADADSYLKTILDNLAKAGVQNGWRDHRLEFASLTAHPGRFVHAEGTRRNGGEDSPLRIGVSVGPQYGTVDAEWIKDAAREALRGVGFDLLLVCAFSFDAHASAAANEFKPEGDDFATVAGERQLGRLPILLVRMNADLAMGDVLLKKTGTANLFTVFGEPDVSIDETPDGLVVTIRGVDVYNPTTGELHSGGTDDIALWMVDTAYDEDEFFVRHIYFAGTEGKPDGLDPYTRLRRALRAQLDEAAWATLYATRSRPFPRPQSGKVAVKVINHYDDEVLKVYEV